MVQPLSARGKVIISACCIAFAVPVSIALAATPDPRAPDAYRMQFGSFLAEPLARVLPASGSQRAPKSRETNSAPAVPRQLREEFERFMQEQEQGPPGRPMIDTIDAGRPREEPGSSEAASADLGQARGASESGWACRLELLFNTAKRPFHDARVRRALSMAIDRWSGAKSLSRVAFLRDVGGIMRPGSEYAARTEELIEYPGFGTDAKAARTEAKRLLKEAGARDLKFSITTRSIMPYTVTAVLLTDQWRQIGVGVEQVQLDSAAYEASLNSGGYETALSFACDADNEPNLQLARYLSKDQSPLNHANYTDRMLDDLYDKQKRSTDKHERYRLIRSFEEKLLHESYAVPVIW